jgi:hypothetical protein
MPFTAEVSDPVRDFGFIYLDVRKLRRLVVLLSRSIILDTGEVDTKPDYALYNSLCIFKILF